MNRSRAAHDRTPFDRLAAAFVLILLAVGTFVLWMGIPPLILWSLSQIIDSPGMHLLAALVAIPAAMILFACVLAWMNGLYLRITGQDQQSEAGDDGDGDLGPWLIRRGPLESLLLGSLGVALLAMAAWFFLLAENPLLW